MSDKVPARITEEWGDVWVIADEDGEPGDVLYVAEVTVAGKDKNGVFLIHPTEGERYYV